MRDRRNDSTHSSGQSPRRVGAPSPPPGGEERVGEKEGGFNRSPPNAFDRAFLETFSRREPAPATPQSDQLPLVLTALANLRVRPDALAHFLLAVPDEVLRRCGVILARMAGEGG